MSYASAVALIEAFHPMLRTRSSGTSASGLLRSLSVQEAMCGSMWAPHPQRQQVWPKARISALRNGALRLAAMAPSRSLDILRPMAS